MSEPWCKKTRFVANHRALVTSSMLTNFDFPDETLHFVDVPPSQRYFRASPTYAKWLGNPSVKQKIPGKKAIVG